MKKKILIFGAGGHANSCIDVIEAENKFKIIGLIGKKKEIGKKVGNYEIIGSEENLSNLLKKGVKYAHIALGGIDNLKIRKNLFLYLKKKNFFFPKIISPISYVSKKTQISEGTIVMHGAIINSNTTIGSNCIINTKSLIEHDCLIDIMFIYLQEQLLMPYKIGSDTFTGSGAVLRNNLTIKPNTFIKMGTLLKE